MWGKCSSFSGYRLHMHSRPLHSNPHGGRSDGVLHKPTYCDIFWCLKVILLDMPGRYSKPAEAIDIMHRVRAMLDPNQIMNPYKFLPHTEHRPRP